MPAHTASTFHVVITSGWFRGISPVAACAAYELLLRRTHKGKKLERSDRYIALSLIAAAVAAFPAVLAIRAHDGKDIEAGSWGLLGLVFVGWFLVLYDKETMSERRENSNWFVGGVWSTWVPNLVAGGLLGLVFAYAP